MRIEEKRGQLRNYVVVNRHMGARKSMRAITLDDFIKTTASENSLLARMFSVAVGLHSGGRLAMTLVDPYFQLTGSPKNLGLDPFPDTDGYFVFCRGYRVLGDERLAFEQQNLWKVNYIIQ